MNRSAVSFPSRGKFSTSMTWIFSVGGIHQLPAAALQLHGFNGGRGVVWTRCGHVDGP